MADRVKQLKELGQAERQTSQARGIKRDRAAEAYYHLSGQDESKNPSWRTIWESREQTKVVVLAFFNWGFGLSLYVVLANLLVWVTFHATPKISPSNPGDFSNTTTLKSLLHEHNATDFEYRRELFDLGFFLTPDRYDRPLHLKFAVDVMVAISQLMAPVALIAWGQTQNFTCYSFIISFISFLKGIIQVVTILPPANRGQYCWLLNFGHEELDVIQHDPWYTWILQPWGAAHGCNDMLWSGHTAQSCIGCLFLNCAMREHDVPRFVRMFIGIFFFFYVFCVLSLRMHYSIDVFVAMLMATSMYTHSDFRHGIWYWSNKLVGNPERETVQGSDEEGPTQPLNQPSSS